MPALNLDLAPDGLPRVTVVLRQPQGDSYVQTPELRGVVDNGCSDIVVAQGILARHGFKASGRADIRGAVATGEESGGDAQIVILHAGDDSNWVSLKVLEFRSIPFRECDVIIGVSFLRRAVFTLDGPANKFSLTW
jgi:hypothetical protein